MHEDTSVSGRVKLAIAFAIGVLVVFIILGSQVQPSGPSAVSGPVSTPVADSTRKLVDSIVQAGADRREITAAEAWRTFGRLRSNFECKQDKIYGTAWFTHESQTVENSYMRSYLSAPVAGDGTIYLQSNFAGGTWIFHDHVVARIGDQVLETAAVPSYDEAAHHSNDADMVWEEIVYTSGRDNGMLRALATADRNTGITIRLEGRQNAHDFTLSSRDRTAIRQSVELANALHVIGPVTCKTRMPQDVARGLAGKATP